MAYINALHTHDQSYENTFVLTLFPRINLEYDITFEDTNPTFESVVGSPETQIETRFSIPTNILLKLNVLPVHTPNCLERYQQLEKSQGEELPTQD
jgi:hypothetical protein